MKTRIQELRKAKRISQEELALEVGVTRQTITSPECEKYTACTIGYSAIYCILCVIAN